MKTTHPRFNALTKRYDRLIKNIHENSDEFAMRTPQSRRRVITTLRENLGMLRRDRDFQRFVISRTGESIEAFRVKLRREILRLHETHKRLINEDADKHRGSIRYHVIDGSNRIGPFRTRRSALAAARRIHGRNFNR